MRLRNKKTGKFYTLSEDLYIEYTQGGKIEVRAIIPGGNMSYYYDSLDKLNEDWEDAKEPLIKDPKNRNAVRAWADANDVTKVYVYGIGDGIEYIELYAKDNGVTDGRIRISLPTQDGVWIGEEYAIAELCGSEEIEILEPTYTTIEEKEKLKEEE